MDLEIPHLEVALERKRLVKALTVFRKLRKVSRKHAKELYDRIVTGTKTAQIVTGQPIDTHEEKYLLSQYKKIFADASKPNFVINPKILGGVRMHWGDEMVELTLNGIKN